jgi:hypothetical protein
VSAVVTTPVGYWTGLSFGLMLTSSALDLTTVVGASFVVTNQSTQAVSEWTATLSGATTTSLTLTHHYQQGDTAEVATLLIYAILVDGGGLTYPTSTTQLIVVP